MNCRLTNLIGSLHAITLDNQPSTKYNTEMKIPATTDEIMDGRIGACTRCGKKTYGVEPDAQQYECPDCETNTVFGLQELLLMDFLEIDDNDF